MPADLLGRLIDNVARIQNDLLSPRGLRVTGMAGRTPIIEFVSKANRQVSVANERLTESDVSVAMRAASQACDLWARDFLFVPCSDKRYRVVVDGAAPSERPRNRRRSQNAQNAPE